MQQTFPNSRRGLWILAAALACSASLKAASKPELDAKPFHDGDYGYELQVFRKWSLAAPKAGADCQKSWTGEGGQRLEVYAWLANPKGDAPPAEGEEADPLCSRPASLEALEKDPKTASAPFEVGQGLNGTRYDFAGDKGAGVAFEVTLPGRTVALVYTTAAGDLAAAVPAFESSAKSLKAETGWSADKALSTIRRAQSKAEALARAAAEPGWRAIEMPRYVIITDMPASSAFPKTAAQQLEAIRDLYERLIPGKHPIDVVAMARVFKNKEEYLATGVPPSTIGVWVVANRELTFFCFGENDKKTEEKGLAVMRHEAWHQYIFYCMGQVKPHPWIDEGIGDFFGGAVVGTSSGGKTPVTVAEWDRRGSRLDETLAKGPLPASLQDLVHLSQAEFCGENSSVYYAEAWSLVYYLLKAAPAGSPYQKIISNYFTTLERTGDPEQADTAAFQGIDMKALEKDWLAFWKDKAKRKVVEKSEKVAPILPPANDPSRKG